MPTNAVDFRILNRLCLWELFEVQIRASRKRRLKYYGDKKQQLEANACLRKCESTASHLRSELD